MDVPLYIVVGRSQDCDVILRDPSVSGRLEDGIRIQVTDSATSYVAAREALEASRIGVEAAEESYRVQLERYRAGAATLTDLTDAAGEQARAQLELVAAATTARIAAAALARSLGTGASEE